VIEDVVKNVLNIINLQKTTITLTDAGINQIVQFISDTGVELSKRVRWDKLIKEAVTGGNIISYDLPSDFQQLSLSGGIILNKANFVPCRLITSKVLWQLILKNVSSVYYSILSDDKIEFSKEIDADGVKFYYFSLNWLIGNKSKIDSLSDISLIPENLLSKGGVWRWKREKGLPYDDELAEYEAIILSEAKASRGL
jgi:hypothetical protein